MNSSTTRTPDAAAQLASVVSSLAGVSPEGLSESDRVAVVAVLEAIKGASAAAPVNASAISASPLS